MPGNLRVGLCLLAAIAFAGALIPFGARQQQSNQRAGDRPDLELEGRLCIPSSAVGPNAPRTVVVVVNQGCPYCRQARAFHEILWQRCQIKGIPVVCLLPDREDNNQLADELRAAGKTVARADLRRVGIIRVPTVLAMDSAGTILGMWTGASPAGEQVESVIAELVSGQGKPRYRIVRREDFRALTLREEGVQILSLVADPGGRRVRYAHKTIPIQELSVRADYELSRDRALYVDCTHGDVPPWWCQQALLTLASRKFTRLFAVGLVSATASGYCDVRGSGL